MLHVELRSKPSFLKTSNKRKTTYKHITPAAVSESQNILFKIGNMGLILILNEYKT